MPRHRTRDGFALPLTVFLISMLTLLLTAAFAKVQADRRVAGSSGATVSALAVAKSGLHNYLGTMIGRPPDGDSVRINVTGGYAEVVARVVRRPADTLANWLYIVRSTGRVIDPTQGKDPQAVRTIAQFAQWQTGQIDVRGAITAVDGLKRVGDGSNVWIYGTDFAGCGAPTTAGIHTRNGGDPGLPGGNITGSPAVADTAASATVVTALSNIDWVAMTGGGFTPDYTAYRPGDTTYSSQLISGSTTIDNLNGTGLLIVTVDLTLTGLANWSGIIILGGKLFFNGTGTTIRGLVIEGLNKGGNKSNVGNTPLWIYYDSCNVRRTMSRLTGFAPITNGWVDNWATY